MTFALFMDLLGWIGGVEVVIGYILISLKRVRAENFYYQILNVTGAFLLIINTWYHKAYPSAIVNIIWVGIAVYSMLKFKEAKASK